jgi:chaperonin cofactor prefoldin
MANPEISQLRARIGTLNDRIQILEKNLERTQEKVTADISRIIKMITKNPADSVQDGKTTSTYRGP